MEYRPGDKTAWCYLLTTVVLLAIAGCGPRSSPPGVSSVAGGLGNAHYVLLHTKPGLRIMIWDDLKGGHSYHGSGSSSDPVYRFRGEVKSTDGEGYELALETTNGKTAKFTLDGKEYDLARGGLFLLRRDGDKTAVEQLNRDLSGIAPTNEGCMGFGQQDLDIKKFVESSE